MSYRFVVPFTGPDESLLRQAGAEFSRLGEHDARGWIAWRGRPARGVFVFEEDGNAHFKLPTLASDDDVALAQELAVRHARLRSVPIDAEEPPAGVDYESETAPEAPSGYPGIFLFTPDAIEKWPKGWHSFQSAGGLMTIASLAREGGAALLSGPFRRAYVGARLVESALGTPTPSRGLVGRVFGRRRTPPSDGLRPAVSRLIERLVEAQDPAVARLPLRPRFLNGSLKTPRGAPWSPTPYGTLMPPFAHQGDITVVDRQDRDDAHHTVAVPGERYLLPLSDYVAIRETAEAWRCVPFASFVEVLGAAFVWLDEFTGVVAAPSADAWAGLVARLAPMAAARIEHQDDFLKTAQELTTGAA